MLDIEETAKTYDMDYVHAPVGLFVLTVWVGSIALGLFGFILNWLTAKGFGPYIVQGQRSFVRNDVSGILDGVAAFVVLFVLSLLLGFVGRSMTLKKQKIDALWKLSYLGIPLLTVAVAAVAVFLNH